MKNKQPLLKSLFSISIIGVLTLVGLIQFNIAAADAPQDSYKGNGGASVQIKPDGTKVIQDADGSLIQIMPDGSKIIRKPDGSSVEIKSDGSKIIKGSDGSLIEVKPDGSKTIRKSDGTSIQVPAGSKDQRMN